MEPSSAVTFGEKRKRVDSILHLEQCASGSVAWDEWTVGDQVVFFPAGYARHDDYDLYADSLPEGDMFRCTVDAREVKSTNKVKVRLTLLDSDKEFSLAFDPNAGLPEFIVLESAYDAAMEVDWAHGREFLCSFDGEVYRGKVTKQLPSLSGWESIRVLWEEDENGKFEVNRDFLVISPWEIFPVEEPLQKRAKVSREDILAAGKAKEQRRLQRGKENEVAMLKRRLRMKELQLAREEEAKAKRLRAEEEMRKRKKQEEEELARKLQEEKERKAAEELALKLAEVEKQRQEEEERRRCQERAEAAQALMRSQLAKSREEAQRRREEEESKKKARYSVAVVCASNMNRSMEAHNVFLKKGLNVTSYGTGQHVKIPGRSKSEPNVYSFGTASYLDIKRDLKDKDKELYTRNGLLNMLERNIAVKEKPERFQDIAEEDRTMDVIICFEERVFEAVVNFVHEVGNQTMKPVQIMNLEVRDNHESAMVGARDALALMSKIEELDDLEDEIEDVVAAFNAERGKQVMHTVAFW